MYFVMGLVRSLPFVLPYEALGGGKNLAQLIYNLASFFMKDAESLIWNPLLVCLCDACMAYLHGRGLH